MKINTNNLTSKTMSNPLIIVLVLLIILIIVLAIFRSVSPFLNLGFEINAHIGDLKTSFEIEAFNNSEDIRDYGDVVESYEGNDKVLVMYYANWCGHCKRTKPEFQQLIDSYKGKIKVLMIDCEEPENKALVKSQKINGFPTIRFYPSGLNDNYEEYTGGRTYSDFIEYLNGVSGVIDRSPDNAAPV
jgi:thiol-disulfide isomerase/thioredoxin